MLSLQSMTRVFSIEEIEEVAREFIRQLGDDRVFLFDGDMGAGKTTFIAEVCRQLGADDDFGSPTFSIVNEYSDSEGNPIYHFDLYRIENPQEVLDIGADEYFYSGDLCFVEWPDRLGSLVPEDARLVKITVNPDDTRTISVQ